MTTELSTNVASKEVLTELLDRGRILWIGKRGVERYNAMLYLNRLLDQWNQNNGIMPEPPTEVPEGYYHQEYNIAED